jgi:hypothetical protein
VFGKELYLTNTLKCQIQLKNDDQGSQGGKYTPLVKLIHRIVYMYTKGKPIFISMLHPSGFVVGCYGLMEWITALENYSVDLRDIYFLFYGLKLIYHLSLIMVTFNYRNFNKELQYLFKFLNFR